MTPTSPTTSTTWRVCGGRAAAGLMEQAQEQVDMGLPPLWSVYLTVDDADATVGKVEAAGGSVMAPAFDVMDAGRMAVIVDPAGAVVCLWQPKEHPGCEIVNEPGAFTWAELQTARPGRPAPSSSRRRSGGTPGPPRCRGSAR